MDHPQFYLPKIASEAQSLSDMLLQKRRLIAFEFIAKLKDWSFKYSSYTAESKFQDLIEALDNCHRSCTHLAELIRKPSYSSMISEDLKALANEILIRPDEDEPEQPAEATEPALSQLL